MKSVIWYENRNIAKRLDIAKKRDIKMKDRKHRPKLCLFCKYYRKNGDFQGFLRDIMAPDTGNA